MVIKSYSYDIWSIETPLHRQRKHYTSWDFFPAFPPRARAATGGSAAADPPGSTDVTATLARLEDRRGGGAITAGAAETEGGFNPAEPKAPAGATLVEIPAMGAIAAETEPPG